MESQHFSLYDEYEYYTKKYKEEYGEKCVVLYQCGQFFEVYSANDGLVDIKTISELLNIQVSRRNKSILEVNRSNTLMAGFPMFALRKFINILVENNYIVVIVEQIAEPSGKQTKFKRAVTEVISPGTMINEGEIQETNNLISLYFDEIKSQQHQTILCIGIAIIDLNTGFSKVTEVASKPNDFNYSLDETFRVINTYNPKEIIISGDVYSIDYDSICKHLEISKRCVHNKLFTYPKDIKQLAFQDQFLNKIFPKHGLLTVIEHLDMCNKPFSLVAYVYLLLFAHKHNEDILNKISKPVQITDNNILYIHYNSAKQLNILPNFESQSSLLSILNTCVTAMGRRLFKERLLSPIRDVKALENRYNIIEAFLNNNIFEAIRINLKGTYDLERLSRKMNIGKFHPCDMILLDDTINELLDIIKYSVMGYFEWSPENTQALLGMKENYMCIIKLEEASKYNLDTIEQSFFKKGVYTDVDELQEKLNAQMKFIEDLREELGKACNGDNYFKLENNERDGYHYVITQKRFNEVKTRLSNDMISSLVTKTISATSSNIKVFHKSFNKINESISFIKQQLKSVLLATFKKYIKEFYETHEDIFEKVIKLICDIDIVSTHARNAFKYNYHRPIIKESKKAFIKATDLRHPIIERINDKVEYVTNDIHVGCDDQDGILLFGLNCSGKTSLSKAVALNIIMAQVGSFVPAKMEYSPYDNIFTRIPSGDDIFKSMSTFAVEMVELRNILQRATANSLIVGDEISHGTEVISGVAIVGAAICELAQRQSSFIFATHLHNITEVERVKVLNNIKLYHLEVKYDDTTKKLIYDRKLKPGSGASIYGIEVCRSLDLPSSFMEIANEIRRDCIGNNNIISFNKSRYNNNVYFDKCDICAKESKEIHHIKHQCKADSRGYIDSTFVNNKNNLMNVCTICHDKIHAGDINIEGYKQTSNGVELFWSSSSKNNEYPDNIVDIIIDYKQKRLSMEKIVTALKEDYNINITRYKINKLLLGTQKHV